MALNPFNPPVGPNVEYLRRDPILGSMMLTPRSREISNGS
jgi:hypothetical protein